MTFDPDGNPLPPKGEERARTWVSLLMPPLWVLLVLGGMLLLREWSRTPLAAPAASGSITRSATASSSPPSTAPRDLAMIASALSTMAAPSPTATPNPSPTPTYASLPTMTAMYCGRGAAYGRLCEWPRFTPTPQPSPPVCVTPVEGAGCIWRGLPTPTPAVPVWPASLVR